MNDRDSHVRREHDVIQHDQDGLNGLHGRAYIENYLDQELLKESRGAFLMMDLDNFKLVNDTLGHATGDEVLKAFASVLRDNAREYDVIARMGGDEFAIFYPGFVVQDGLVRRCQQIQEGAQKAFRKVLQSAYELLNLSVSIGAVIVPQDGNTFAEIYQNADHALFQVKRTKKGCFNFYGTQVADDAEGSLNQSGLCTNCDTMQLHNLEELGEQIQESRPVKGAYNTSYAWFREIYLIMLRRHFRVNVESQVVLFTLHLNDNASAEERAMFERANVEFCILVTTNLRQGDITTRYGNSQLLVLLNDSQAESSDGVVDRIEKLWVERATPYTVTHEISEFPIEEKPV